MSFERTNLVDRMGALTLIIMGEGIIGMTESISSILKTSSKISPPTVGLVIAMVLIIYLLWMLYFDQTDKSGTDGPGERITNETPYCQIWAFVHFPLHVAILLTLEGSVKLMVLWIASQAFGDIVYQFADYYEVAANRSQLVGLITQDIRNLSKIYPTVVTNVQSNGDLNNSLKQLGRFYDSWSNSSFDNGTARNFFADKLDEIEMNFLATMCDSLEIPFPEEKFAAVKNTSQAGSQAVEKKLEAFLDINKVWFITFFVAAGCVLIFLALLWDVGHEKCPLSMRVRGKSSGRRKGAWVAVSLQCIIGTGLALTSLTSLLKFWTFTASAWVMPTVLIAFALGKAELTRIVRSLNMLFSHHLRQLPLLLVLRRTPSANPRGGRTRKPPQQHP